MASALARLGVLAAAEYIDTVDAGTTAVVAYYGATFPLGRHACEQVDVAKRRGLAQLGHIGWRTARWLVHAARPEGMGMAVTWVHAAAALVVEVDKACNASPTAPARIAIASRIARGQWGLGWRPTRAAPVPQAWNPWHALGVLTEEGIVEAARKYLMMAGVEMRAARGDGAADALAPRYQAHAEAEEPREMIWEAPGRQYGCRLARLGVARLAQLYGGEETHGPSP